MILSHFSSAGEIEEAGHTFDELTFVNYDCLSKWLPFDLLSKKAIHVFCRY